MKLRGTTKKSLHICVKAFLYIFCKKLLFEVCGNIIVRNDFLNKCVCTGFF